MSQYPAVPGLPFSHPLRVAKLSGHAPTAFDIAPDADVLATLAGFLGISRLRKLRFAGTIAPISSGGWELTGTLGATVVQPCTISLAPVTTRIDEPVLRRYLPDLADAEASETEIPEDVDSEPLRDVIDPAAVMIEALALALPPFPRAEGVELGEAIFTEPGKAPLRDKDARPLAGLAALRDKLGK